MKSHEARPKLGRQVAMNVEFDADSKYRLIHYETRYRQLGSTRFSRISSRTGLEMSNTFGHVAVNQAVPRQARAPHASSEIKRSG